MKMFSNNLVRIMAVTMLTMSAAVAYAQGGGGGGQPCVNVNCAWAAPLGCVGQCVPGAGFGNVICTCLPSPPGAPTACFCEITLINPNEDPGS